MQRTCELEKMEQMVLLASFFKPAAQALSVGEDRQMRRFLPKIACVCLEATRRTVRLEGFVDQITISTAGGENG